MFKLRRFKKTGIVLALVVALSLILSSVAFANSNLLKVYATKDGDNLVFEYSDLIKAYGGDIDSFKNLWIATQKTALVFGDKILSFNDFIAKAGNDLVKSPAEYYAHEDAVIVEAPEMIRQVGPEGSLGELIPNPDATPEGFEVIEISEIKGIEVPFGTSVEDAVAKLSATYATVTATLNDEEVTEVTLNIAWVENEEYNAEEPGEYEFTGTLSKLEGEELEFTIPETKATVTAKVTVEEEEGLAVESVSAIDKTTVEVVIKALEEDLLGAEIEVLDNEGNKVAVKPVDIAAGDTTVFFEFADEIEKQEGIWTIAGHEYDFDLKANLEAFETAANQIELNKALTDLGIENVKVENMPAYETKKQGFLDKLAEEEKELTVEAIQAWIDEVNTKALSNEESKAIAKKVLDAKDAENDVALLAALQDEAFVRVNPEWLSQYKTAILTTGESVDDTVAKIQVKIDGVNTTQINAELNNLKTDDEYTSVDKEKLLAAKDLIEKYAPVNDKGEITDAAIKVAPKALDIQLAVADVLEATTPTTLKAKLTALDNLLDKADKFMEDEYVEDNAKLYINGYGEGDSKKEGLKGNETVKTATGVKTVITGINAAVEAAQGAIDARLKIDSVTVVDDMYNSTAKGKVRRLGYGVTISVNNGEGNTNLTVGDTESIVVELYKGKTLLGKQSLNATGYEKHSDKKSISGTIDAYGEYVSTSWDNEWYGELTDIPTKAVAKVEYKEDGVAEDKLVLDNVDAKPFYLELVNGAETVEEMDAALLKLAEIEEKSYLNVPKADRLYVAEQVLEARNEIEDTKKFATYDNLTNTLTGTDGVIKKYDAALGAVNALEETDSISDVIAALSFDEGFAKMSIAEQSDIAEAFFLGLYEDGEFVAPNFRTLAAVKAAAGL